MEPKIWSPSETLSARVKKLRAEYFSFDEREYFRNEVMAFSTGKTWDEVYSPHTFGVVPEMYMFFESVKTSLLADAKTVSLESPFWAEPLIVRRALFFKEVVEKYLPVDILAGEVIVGGQFNTALSRTLNQNEMRQWNRMESAYVEQVKKIDGWGFGNAGKTPGHLIPDYKTVLEIGFVGLKARFEERLIALEVGEAPSKAAEGIGARPWLHRLFGLFSEPREIRDPADKTHAKDVLRALILSTEIPKILAGRYADKITVMANQEGDYARKQELLRMARICRKVPWEPAGSYWEALQSLWFTHMLVMAAESYPGAGLSYGRFDQYIFPYFQKDLDSKALDLSLAKELLQCFWIKHNYAYDYQGRIGNNQGINSSFGQLVTLSGMGPNGEDLTNDFTYLCLEVIEELNLLEPKPNVRLHKNTPERLLRRVSEIIAKAQGAPFLLNFDELSMKALEWIGLPKDKLWDYAPVGCLENTLQGNDRSGTVDVNINLAKAVELVLFDGKDLVTHQQVGPKSGDPRSFKTFADFFTAYEIQTRFIMETLIDLYNLSDEIAARFEPTPYLSTLVRGCEDKGKDIVQGGALYNFVTMEGVALGTTIDSLMAVKQLVFDQKQVPMEELILAIKANFEGHEPLRQRLINKVPKYGNDIPEVDALGKRVSEFWSTEVCRYQSPFTGRKYRAGYLSWNYWISYAPKTAATPDGRKRGSFLSNGLCPVNGADKQGPTAIIKSVGNLGLETIPNGGSHTFSLSPSLVRDAEHIEKLMALLRAYIEHGGTALQINILDAETLKKAQKNPEKYQNLLVRVTGYNAYFVAIGKEIQDEIISRVAHTY